MKQLHGRVLLRINPLRAMNTRLISYYHSEGDSFYVNEGDKKFSSEWYDLALLKLRKWTNMLKNLDLIEGKLVDVNQNKRIFDHKLENKMRAFKSVARIFIGHPSMQQSIRDNVISLHPHHFKRSPFFFASPSERQPMIVNSLTRIFTCFNVTVKQRKELRMKVCSQVTQYNVWVTTLQEILNRLKSEIDVGCPSKQLRLAEQIISSCLKVFEISYDPESISWMRLEPQEGRISDAGSSRPQWGLVVEMFNDLLNCLEKETDLSLHVEKVRAMKEGLYQIQDFEIVKDIRYKEIRYHENLVRKQLTYSLGHSSRCLFTLLVYYLFGIVNDLEVEVCGGIYPRGRRHRFYLCMGKILTSTEEKVLQNGMEQLDRALKLFKFVWETAEMKGDLEMQGHLFCVGASNMLLPYRGNSFFLHDLNL